MQSEFSDFPSNPYDGPAHWHMDDEEGGKRGRLELRFVFYERPKPGHRNPDRDMSKAKLETVVLLTRVQGYGTAAIAKKMSDINYTLIQEHEVAEILAFHNWAEVSGFSFKAKDTLFDTVSSPLMRRRLREVRILCPRGLFSTVIDAGLRLSGLKNAQVIHDPILLRYEVENILQRYDDRTLTVRAPVSLPMLQKQLNFLSF